jgi:hypothetical protein
MNMATLHLNSRNERHDIAIMICHLKRILLAISCSSLMACGTRTPEVISTIRPIPEEAPTPTPPIETPPEIEPIPQPVLDFSSSVNTQTKPDSRIPGTWSTVGRLLNPKNAGQAIALHDGRVLLVSFGRSEFKEINGQLTPIKRNTGSGEVFDPKTGTSTPFQDLDYNSSFQLKDGRVVFFHPKRTSIFDPKSNAFRHLNVSKSDPCVNYSSYTELPNARLQFINRINTQTINCELDLENGEVKASSFPPSRMLAYSIGPGTFGFHISEVAMQGPNDSIWKATPLFDLKKQYTESDALQPSEFKLEQFDQSLNMVSTKTVKLPKSIGSAQFLTEDVIDFKSGESGDYGPINCKDNYFSLRQNKVIAVLDYDCGKHHGRNETILFDQSSVLLFNKGEYGNAGHYGMSILKMDTSERTDLTDAINGYYQEVQKASLLPNRSVFLYEVAACPAQSGTTCRLNRQADQIEILGAKTHVFKPTTPNQLRFSATSVQLQDGRIMVVGGEKELPAQKDASGNLLRTFEPLDSIEIYTPEN